jgi:hypothetical protein
VTRILFWNVNNVGSNSLFPSPKKRKRKGNANDEWVPPGFRRPQDDADAIDRLGVLTGVISGAQPDIVSIAEVTTGPGAPAEGTTVNDDAMLKLLRKLRTATPFTDWRLVPPLVVGQGGVAEGMAVFYRSTQLTFLGPWGWSGANADSIANIGALNLAQYGAPWQGGGYAALPSRKIGAGWPTPNVYENRLAAQWQYADGVGTRINFPAAGNRGPLLTWFGDAAHGGGARVIKLLSYHAPPQQNAVGLGVAASLAGTAALAQVREMNGGAIGANEVRCIVGDFNVSAWDDGVDAASYAPLRALGYIQQLNPRGRATVGTAPPVAIAYGWPAAGYYATHSRSLNLFHNASGAHPWINVGDNHTVQGYPGFGWADREGGFGRYDAIDGIFTRHGAAAGAAGQLTIANPITGSPYTAVAAPPNVATGAVGVAVNSQMAAAGAFGLPAGVPEIPQGPGLTAYDIFKDWDNFDKIRSLSDHLPVVIDV